MFFFHQGAETSSQQQQQQQEQQQQQQHRQQQQQQNTKQKHAVSAEAMIVSIPLYQVKMTIIRVIFDRLLPDTFVVLQAHFSHVHHCKVHFWSLKMRRVFVLFFG